MSERLVAHVSKTRMLILIFIGGAFLAAGFWIVINADELAYQKGFDSSAPILFIGAVAILVFGGLTIVGVRQLFRNGPVMEIDTRGILWRRWLDQIIPWSAIVRTEQRAIYNQTFLCVWLDAPEHYPAQSTLGRLSGLNKGMGFGDLALTMQGTDQSFDRLTEVIHTHLGAHNHRVGTGSGPE
ncbi:STM3941 family protein [Sphingomonas sp. LT1P40]|uniref:STM3941 family protein n=1 Tax=Alteristakelama amylovorans TaxID=3096166 RepID=UPI002FC8C9C5